MMDKFNIEDMPRNVHSDTVRLNDVDAFDTLLNDGGECLAIERIKADKVVCTTLFIDQWDIAVLEESCIKIFKHRNGFYVRSNAYRQSGNDLVGVYRLDHITRVYKYQHNAGTGNESDENPG